MLCSFIVFTVAVLVKKTGGNGVTNTSPGGLRDRTNAHATAEDATGYNSPKVSSPAKTFGNAGIYNSSPQASSLAQTFGYAGIYDSSPQVSSPSPRHSSSSPWSFDDLREALDDLCVIEAHESIASKLIITCPYDASLLFHNVP